jgi:Zn-dependent peptidase ImmA (M78 family)/DNA-binding XRE family transcriptional regulator
MINGERVRQARELAGITQSALSKKAGVSQPAIAQIEAGLFQPADEIVDAIALATRMPTSFFRRPAPPEFPLGSLLFRARATAPQREKSKAHRGGQLAFELAELLAARVNTLPVRIPRLATEPVEAARMTRAALGLSPSTPIPNVVHTVERAGVLVVVVPATVEKCDAFSGWAGTELSRPVIALLEGVPGDRLRFSVAHELGHLVLHQAASGMVKEIEAQADQFASEFLVPESGIRQELSASVTLTSIAPLKRRWGVSMQMLLTRARNLEIISPRRYRFLYQQLGASGWRTLEPENLAVRPEKPRAVRKMAELVFGSSLSPAKIAEELGISLVKATELISAYAAQTDLVSSTRSVEPGSSNVIHMVSRRRAPSLKPGVQAPISGQYEMMSPRGGQTGEEGESAPGTLPAPDPMAHDGRDR